MSTVPNITIMLVRLDELRESYPDADEYLRYELSKAYPALAAEIRRLSAYSDRLRDAVEWMSGSPSFGPGEEAGDAFRRNVLPLLSSDYALPAPTPEVTR